MDAIVDSAQLRVMSGSEPVCTKPVCIAPHLAEFYLTVAQDVRVRCTSGFVFFKKMGENLLTILVGEIDSVQRQFELLGDFPRVLKITRGVAITVVFTVAHVQADNIVSLSEASLTEKPLGHAGVLLVTSITI